MKDKWELSSDNSVNYIARFKKNISGIFHATGKSCVNRYEFALVLANTFGLGLLKCFFSFSITGADFSQEMLDLIPHNIYHQLELIDLNEKLKYEDNFFDAITCVGTFTYGHVKANALNELIRILKKNGLICFTINEGIYKKYQFDLKIKQLSDDKLWDIIDISKCSYIVNKEIEAWLCIAKKN